MNQQATYQLLVGDVTQIFLLSVGAFLLAMALTPFYTYMAYRYRFWKKQRSTSTNGEALEIFTKLHASKFRRNIPTMAGVIGVVTITVITFSMNARTCRWLR
jgi:phospho-N-acetylmuramoyl-pentapeptide-transferase